MIKFITKKQLEEMCLEYTGQSYGELDIYKKDNLRYALKPYGKFYEIVAKYSVRKRHIK